jgi:hypothetical protein
MSTADSSCPLLNMTTACACMYARCRCRCISLRSNHIRGVHGFAVNLHQLPREKQCTYVKKAHKTLARKWHPDKARGNKARYDALLDACEARSPVSSREHAPHAQWHRHTSVITHARVRVAAGFDLRVCVLSLVSVRFPPSRARACTLLHVHGWQGGSQDERSLRGQGEAC